MREFALNADMEYKQLSLIEHGKINTTISTVKALSEALEVPFQEMFNFKYHGKERKGHGKVD